MPNSDFEFDCYEIYSDGKVIRCKYTRFAEFNAYAQQDRGVWKNTSKGIEFPPVQEHGVIHRKQIPTGMDFYHALDKIKMDLRVIQGEIIKVSEFGRPIATLELDKLSPEILKERCSIEYPPGYLVDKFFDRYAQLIHDFWLYCFDKHDPVDQVEVESLIDVYHGLPNSSFKWASKSPRWLETLELLRKVDHA